MLHPSPASTGPKSLSRRRVLALALFGPITVGSATAACGRSGTPGPDPLEDQLKAARRDSAMAAAAVKTAPPPAVPALTVIATERSRHAEVLLEELSRAAGKPIPTAAEAPPDASTAPTTDKPVPPPSVDDVARALRESADSAAKLAPTLSGYRAGLLGSIAAACATSLAVGFNSTERHR